MPRPPDYFGQRLTHRKDLTICGSFSESSNTETKIICKRHNTPPAPVATATRSHTCVHNRAQQQTNFTDFFGTDIPEVIDITQARPMAMSSATGLTKDYVRRTSQKEPGFPFCGQWGCKFCPLLNKTGTIICTTTKKMHPSMKNISCRNSNLIYAITCKRCGLQYVGQTMLQLGDRFTGHFGDINNSRQEKTIGRHFSQHGHQGVDYVDNTCHNSNININHYICLDLIPLTTINDQINSLFVWGSFI